MIAVRDIDATSEPRKGAEIDDFLSIKIILGNFCDVLRLVY